MAEARQHVYAVIDSVVSRQASVIAFERVFLLMGVSFACTLPLLLLFRTGRIRGGEGSGALDGGPGAQRGHRGHPE